jgi:hypothetical protein
VRETLDALGGSSLMGYEEMRRRFPYLPPARYVMRAEHVVNEFGVSKLVLELLLAPPKRPEPGPDEFGIKE